MPTKFAPNPNLWFRQLFTTSSEIWYCVSYRPKPNALNELAVARLSKVPCTKFSVGRTWNCDPKTIRSCPSIAAQIARTEAAANRGSCSRRRVIEIEYGLIERNWRQQLT